MALVFLVSLAGASVAATGQGNGNGNGNVGNNNGNGNSGNNNGNNNVGNGNGNGNAGSDHGNGHIGNGMGNGSDSGIGQGRQHERDRERAPPFHWPWWSEDLTTRMPGLADIICSQTIACEAELAASPNEPLP